MDSRLYNEIGKAAKNGKTLTEKNLPYVWHVATELSSSTGADVEELFMVGVTEMCEKESTYDPNMNTGGFTKYCGFSVRCKMLNYINRGGVDLVHIPANHKRGYKKGFEENEDNKASYVSIDASDYDSFGSENNSAFSNERMDVVMKALDSLDDVAQTVVKMKFRIGEYGETVNNPNNPCRLKHKYSNNMKAIAEELGVPVAVANKIYKSAMTKLENYCKSQCD